MLKKQFCLVVTFLFVHSSCAAMVPNTYIAFIQPFTIPYNMAITPNGLYGYVCDNGSNSVIVIDTDSSSPTFNTQIDAPHLYGVFNLPVSVAITPDNKFAYVCDYGSNSVLVIDTDPASPTFNNLITALDLSGVFTARQ